MKLNLISLRRQCAAALCSLAAAASVLTLTASADEPYEVYNYNRLGEAVPSQAGYLAERAVSGTDLGTTAFSSPQDFFRSADDCFYIADTGSSRIVKTDGDLTGVLHIYDSFTMPDGSRTALKKPNGVYVSPDTGLLYIADTENNRALVCDADGNVRMEITKPDSPVYDSELTFLPQKILCDSAGNIYIVLSNTTKGAAMFSADGAFIGYDFTVDNTEPEIVHRLLRRQCRCKDGKGHCGPFLEHDRLGGGAAAQQPQCADRV